MESKEENKYILYWYHLNNHTDPYTQGYIGITGREEKRKLEHLSWAKTKMTHFTNAIAKYGKENIIYKVLHRDLSMEVALELEYEYRQDVNIGWNMAVGGENTLLSIVSTPISIYHKDNYVRLLSFPSIEEACKATKANYGSLQQMSFRKSMLYNKEGWAVLHEPLQDRSLTLTLEENRAINMMRLKRSASVLKGRPKWTEAQKKAIGDFHRGKTISIEQKEITREKNRQNHPTCSPITLKHRSSDEVYKYHSISEASRQLNLPLSRLKSKVQRTLGVYGKDGWAVLDYISNKQVSK